MFGSYYVYDNPTALAKTIKSEMDISDTKYNLLYSVYSFPNIVLPFFGGVFVDVFGTNITMFVFLVLICIGQGVFALGVSMNNFVVALMGRMIFGFGGESLSVAQSTLLALWFRGKEVAFAMGVNLSIARVGSVVNDNVSPAAYNAWSLGAAIWVGFFICCVSLGATIALIMLEKYAAKKAEDAEKEKILSQSASDDLAGPSDNPEEEQEKPTAMQAFRKVVVDLVQDIRDFTPSYWLITVSCVVVYSCILPFNNIAGDLIQDKYGYDQDEAGRYLMIPFLISACSSPFLGGAVDIFGRRAVLLTFSAAFLVVAHMVMGFTHPPAPVPLVIIGASYCVYAAAMWPSVSYVVEPRVLGTAYGFITSVQNGGLAVVPLIVGAIKDKTGSYRYVELFFACFAFCGVFIGIALNIVDARAGGVLNRAHVKVTADESENNNTAPLLNATADNETGYVEGKDV